MKQVIGIVGSLRKASYNRIIFNTYQTLAENFFTLQEGEYKDFPLYNSDISPEPEIVKKLSQQIKNADAIIFFTPEYNYSIPGGLKNAIDWLSRNTSQPFDDKYAAIIGASPGNIGTARMQYHLRQVGVFLNLNFINKPEIMIGQCHDKISEGKIIDDSTIQFLKTHIESFARYI